MYMYILITFFAAFCYSLMSFLIQSASNYVNDSTITFFRFFSALIMLIPFYYISGKPTLRTKKPLVHLLRGIFGFLMFTLYSISLKYLPVENALALNSTYPFFIPIILLIFFKEKISRAIIIGTVIGFIGVYIIANPNTDNYLSWASILALLSAVFSAASNVTIRFLRQTESSFSIVFYFFLFSTSVSFIYLIIAGFNALNFKLICLLFGIALTGVASQQCISYVLKFLHPNIVSILMYSSIVFGFVFSWAFLGSTPDIYQIIGTIFIFLGGFIIIKYKSTARENLKKVS
jgi:drug/metabolite transporter (DMT)-like permease